MVEHFTAIRDRLQPGGLFYRSLPLHQPDLATLRSIVQSCVAVCPGGSAVLATSSLGTPGLRLIARPDDARFDPAAVRTRLRNFTLRARLAQLHLDDDFAVFGSFFAALGDLQRFAADDLSSATASVVPIIHPLENHSCIPLHSPPESCVNPCSTSS